MTTYMVADTQATTSKRPGQQEPPPMGIEETVRHLANSIAHLMEQLQTLQERLDRQGQEYEQICSTHPLPATQERQLSPRRKFPAPSPRKDQREVAALTIQPPPRQGQLGNSSP